MKIYLVVLTLTSSVFAENWTPKNNDQLQDIHSECSRKYGLNTAEVFPTNDKNIKNYFLCTVEETGIYVNNLGYNVDRFAKQFKYGDDEAQAKKSAEDCITEYYKPDSEGDKGNREVLKCFIRKQAGLQK